MKDCESLSRPPASEIGENVAKIREVVVRGVYSICRKHYIRSCWDILTNVFSMSRVVTKFVSRVLTETKYSGNLKGGSNRSKKRPRFLE